MASITVVAIEAVQSIQNARNDVPLVAGKTTYVRVYLKAAGIPAGAEVRGRLSAKVGGSSVDNALDSLNAVSMPGNNALADMRLDWSASLNFILPQAALIGHEGKQLRLRLEMTQAGGVKHDLKQKDAYSVKIAAATGLRCRILRFRCRDEDNLDFVEPTRGDAAAIQRYVESSFPVGRVEWSDIRLAAPREFHALEPVARDSAESDNELTRWYMLFFQHMLAIRERDIRLNRDADTFYLGLFDDPSGRFGGAAMDSPQFAAPHVVSIATLEPEGDLGAHELAHALGRRHPGVPDACCHGAYIGQRREPHSRKYEFDQSWIHLDPRGFLSAYREADDGLAHIGVDSRFNRDAPELLSPDACFDLMTYRYPKWVSDLTYLALMGRLQEIQIHAKQRDFSNPDCSADVWTVIGEYDLNNQSGEIFYAARTGYKTPFPIKRKKRMKMLQLAWPAEDEKGKPVLATEYVYFRRYRDLDGSDSIGVFQHTIGLRDDKLDKFRRLGGKKLDAKKRALFWAAFDKVSGKHGELQLLLNGSVVDSVRQSQKKREKIRANLEQASLSPIRSEKCKDEQLTQSEIWLEYSLDDGGYFLNFRWRWSQIKKSDSLRALTSIACQRDRGGKPEPEQWETVAVSRARRDRIWISPAFFGPEPEGDRHPVYGHNFPGGDAIRRQKIELRIEIDIGLETVHREITLGLPANLEQAVSKRRDQAGGYLDCPGTEAESAAVEQAEKQGRVDPRQWYSDSI